MMMRQIRREKKIKGGGVRKKDKGEEVVKILQLIDSCNKGV